MHTPQTATSEPIIDGGPGVSKSAPNHPKDIKTCNLKKITNEYEKDSNKLLAGTKSRQAGQIHPMYRTVKPG